ncbi:MAG TPA: VOC family protein [Methylophilus sp.]|uniref:VOC family protein n=1 Tax=Methylophilus sp. TaxID=29541 RepID=UPI002C9ABD64|nr:VOC family protein [Methylophilus sp.]HSH87413.1 VOC family protein [Methylophilus sp.]
MKPCIAMITLGVDNLEASLRFYRDGLGLVTEGIMGTEFEYGAVVFFELKGGLRLALWPRNSLAHDATLPVSSPGPASFSIAHNVGSKAEVDEVLEQARKSGAMITKPAQDTFWGGYGGYFQDPDGHLWEVVWNPEWRIEE